MRKDGYRVRDANPMYTVVPYIMSRRYDAMNMIEVDIPIAPIQVYLNEKRKQGCVFSHLGLLIAAYLRTAAEYPLLNRFIANKRIYQRHEFCVSMVVLKPGEPDGTMNKMYFSMDDNVFRVHEIIDEYIANNRQQGDTNATDKLITTLLGIPGLCNLGVGLFKLMDRFGLLPKSIIHASPFHVSLVVSNLASIRTNHIYHHLYDFGTSSVFITMGNMREVPRRVHGEIKFERCMPLGIVLDERICSGSYFAMAFRRFRQYLAEPSLLEPPAVPAETKLG